MEPVRLAGADARPGRIGEPPRWCSFPPERLLERSVKMNPGEIVLARRWSTGRWRRECPPNPQQVCLFTKHLEIEREPCPQIDMQSVRDFVPRAPLSIEEIITLAAPAPPRQPAGRSTSSGAASGVRGMASTRLNEMGCWNPDAIERQLAHQESDDVRRAYLHAAEYWPERVRMMQAWADYLDELRDAEKVIPLRREHAQRE
jgi:integrase